FLRPARLEQFGDARQTAGDVARLRALGRDARDDVAGFDLRARIDRQNGVDREQIARVSAAAELEDLAVLALDDERGAQVLLVAGGARAPVGHHALGDAGRLVDGLRHRLTLDQVLEADRALDLGEDRTGVRIPLGDALAARYLVAVIDLD